MYDNCFLSGAMKIIERLKACSKVSIPLLYMWNFLSVPQSSYYNEYIEGFRSEWCISSMMYSRYTSFWSETLDMNTGFRLGVGFEFPIPQCFSVDLYSVPQY